MLRINLLPPSVALARATKKLFIGFLFLFVAIVGSLLTWYFVLVPQVEQEKTLADNAIAAKANVDSIDAQAATTTASIAPIQAKLDFYDKAQAYNTAYLSLYHNIFMYTSPDVVYNSLTVSGTTMTISGFTPSFSALGRYLLEMYKEPDITNLTLTSTIPDSTQPNPNTPQMISLPGGIAGRLPGYPAPVTSYTVLNGRITAVNQGGNAIAGGFGAPQFGAPQFAGPRTGAAGAGNNFDLRHDGFPFTVTLMLKTQLTAPQPPQGGAAAAGNGQQGQPNNP
jgi:Tfp pilus assembly protein PilN